MSFFDELKRRNVFRVGIAYAVGAWLLLQFTEVITELLSLPPTIGPVVVALVAIGFPVALFLAWAYELTPDGVRREAEVDRERSITASTGKKLNALIMALLVVAVALLLLDKFLLRETPPGAPALVNDAAPAAAAQVASAAPEEPAAAAPAVDPHSIAVLPFTNRSPVAEDEFFIDGIHDDLLTNLSRIGGLKVISRTSVTRFRDTDTPIPEIARQLGVATVMEGAVQRAGNTVRINVQLIDAGTDEHLWAQIYDRDMTTDNLFAIQTEIAENIARALETELTPEEARRLRDRPTDNLAAYSAYLKGMRLLEQREVEGMRQALAELQRAVELDPEFAHAWAGLTMVAEVLPSWGGMTRAEGKAISVPAAERAMALAPDLGEANLALAMALEGEESLAQFRVAVDMLPNNAMAHQWYANALQGPPGPNWLQALDLLRRAAELDPLSPNYGAQVARQLLLMNRYREAERELQVVVDTFPEFAPAKGFMSWAAGGKGDMANSLVWSQRYLDQDPTSGFARDGIVIVLSNLRDRNRLLAVRDAWTREGADPNVMRTVDLALAYLDGRFEAVGELLRGAEPHPGLNPAVESAIAMTYARNYPAALGAWQAATPGLFAADRRAEAIREDPDLACLVADVAGRMGETDLGRSLALETASYVADELPRFMEHAGFGGNLAYCFATLGDYDRALEQLETNYRDRQFAFWWEARLLEMFDPLRGDPRYEDLMQAFEDEMARQRAALDRLEQQEASGA